MRILIVGGTGPIGAHAALHLADKGHEVVISSRNPPSSGDGLKDLAWMQGNYLESSYTPKDLKGFDTIIFAAGSAVRHVPPGEDADAHYLKANGELIPAFAKMAKEAGVSTFIHIGSFYPQVVPEKIETDPYVRSRHLADRGVCALSDEGFRAMSLNAPFVVGCPAGMKSAMFAAYVGYARGLHPHIKPFGPSGATNFISVRSLSEAIDGALNRGIGGTSYLLGDENLSFADYFKIFFEAVGNNADVPALDAEHPMLPDSAIIPGRGTMMSYEPDAEEAQLLGYRRNDVRAAIEDIVADIERDLDPIEPVNLSQHARAIPELKTIAEKYARAADTGDAALMASIFTEDAIINGPGFKLDSREEIAGIPAMLSQFYLKTQHVVHQQLADADGDTAVAETYCTAHHILFPDAKAGDQVLTWHVRYQDRFEKRGGNWLLKRRGLIVDWMEVRPIFLPHV